MLHQACDRTIPLFFTGQEANDQDRKGMLFNQTIVLNPTQK